MCSIRTNNDVEGWHNNLNSRVGSRDPVPFYLLVTELFKEASDLPMTLRLVTEGKLRRYGVIHVIHYWNDCLGPYRPNPRKRL
jgi:hypothetical protein